MTGTATRAAPQAVPPGLAALRFDGLAREVIVPDRPAFLDGMHAILKGWPMTARPLDQAAMTAMTAGAVLSAVFPEDAAPGRYVVGSAYTDAPMRNLPLASALCALVADLSQGHADAAPAAQPALHCGAFSAGAGPRGGLVAITGPHRAGKSTLISRLTADPRFRVYCDDVLPLTHAGAGLALGIAPRLRLPLPDGASDAFRAHVAAHLGPHDDRYGYLCPPGLAPHGDNSPLRALILLDRREGPTPARLHHLDAAEAVHHLIVGNLTPFDTADEAMAALMRLMPQLAVLRLVYADLEDAADLIGRAFANGPRPDPALPIAPALPPATQARPDAEGAAAILPYPHQRFARAPGVAMRRVGGQGGDHIGASLVLWSPDTPMVWTLNPVARAAWDLLEEPASAADLADLLAEAFPDVAPARLSGDMAALLGGLARADLVVASA